MVPRRLTYFIDRPRARRLAGHLAEFIEAHHTVLDCGCGKMYIADLLRQHTGAKVIGTDIANFNETKTGMEICLCPGESLPFADSSVDTVMLIFVLHHSRDSLKILRECARVARKRVVIFEDIYKTPVELFLLKIFDWLGNRPVSSEIPLPFTFKTEEEWGRVFHALGAKLTATRIIRPLFFLPTRHRGFVLEV